MGMVAVAVAGDCERARAQYEDLALEEALQSSFSDPTNPVCQEVRALVLIALGRRTDAETTLHTLFEKWPDHPVDLRALAPIERAFIGRIRAARRPLSVDVTAEWLVHS
ncbi:MAG: hypothetical protein AAF449_22505, partial [Myxococcota bacterium]